MPDLIQKASEFRVKVFPRYRELFGQLGTSQKPHTLFIACSDSRLDPNLITGSNPGDLFVLRNIANIVPDYDRATSDVAASSAIEYAVKSLQVENIVVCGHSNCGGCRAMCSASSEKLEFTSKWLDFAGSVHEVDRLRNACSEQNGLSDHEITTDSFLAVELENVLQQLHSLLTYPYIRERRDSGKLSLFGWHYDIETGTVQDYDWESKEFRIL
ncbi:MAG: carbonic anhydrase [Spirochaeta sp.]